MEPGQITDEREGLPSASGADKLVLCSGSWALELQSPKINTAKKYAEFGDNVHAVVDGQEVELSHREEDTAKACKEIEESVRQKWLASDVVSVEEIREQRMWLFNSNLKKVFSGKPDLVVIQGKRALILDFKALSGEVAESPRNWQLRSLAVIVANHYDVEEITVGIVQPWVTRKPELCVYDEEALKLSEKMLRDALVAAELSTSPRTPGDHCKWCRAKLKCAEFGAWNNQITERPVMELAPADLAKLLSRVPLARKFCDELEQAALEMAAKGVKLPGWDLQIGSPRISDTEEEFIQAYFDRHGLRTPSGRAKNGARKQAEEAWERKFGPNIHVKKFETTRRSWESVDEAVFSLSTDLSEEKLRLVRGKLVKEKGPF